MGEAREARRVRGEKNRWAALSPNLVFEAIGQRVHLGVSVWGWGVEGVRRKREETDREREVFSFQQVVEGTIDSCKKE